MKKFAKIAVGITLAASVAATAGVLAGCSNGSDPRNGTGEAYAVTHSSKAVAQYIGYAKLVYTDGNITDMTLTEVELPSQIYFSATSTVSAEDAKSKLTVTGDDYVIVETSSTKLVEGENVTTYTAKAHYKTVSYGGTTLTFDSTLVDYKVGDQDLKTYLQSEANCKTYYEAAINNQISVTIGGQQKLDVLTKAELSKEENGYWTRQDKNNADYSRWKMNRDATVEYVKENGVSKLLSLTKSTTEVDDLKEDKKVKPWTDGTVVTGATWSDLNSDTTGKKYLSYAQLIVKADGAVKA